METCTNHPELASVEYCEICQQPLCGLCLWYGDDGRRLCKTHAVEHQSAGGNIFSPDVFNQAVRPQVVDRAYVEQSQAPYRGNKNDLNALLLAVVALTSLFSCAGGIYCIPGIAGVLSVLAYQKAQAALDPRRTRNLAVMGMIGAFFGMIPLLIIAAYLAFVLFMTVFMIATGGGGP